MSIRNGSRWINWDNLPDEIGSRLFRSTPCLQGNLITYSHDIYFCRDPRDVTFVDEQQSPLYPKHDQYKKNQHFLSIPTMRVLP